MHSESKPPLTFCDMATFYCLTGGGIRAYYDAKMEWFQRQDRHRYMLIVPGRQSATCRLSPLVSRVEARSIGLTGARDGYRLFADFSHVRSAIRQGRPDVLEAGDPWVSGPFGLLLRQRDRVPPVVASFFHSDPIPTYLQPALRRVAPAWVARAVSSVAGRAFYRLEASYDLTMVGSSFLEDRLRREGVARIRRAPLGVAPVFFGVGRRRKPVAGPWRLLYVGRLDRDKQFDLLLAILPRLLEIARVSVTVAGTGAFAPACAHLSHPRFRYVGYVRGSESVADLCARHDIFLAPGAYETFGLAALEAAAAGLLVVGPDRGGTGALLREMQSPFVFSAGDAESFLSTVLGALQADWPRASRVSRGLAERYGTWPQAIARLIDTYEQWLEARP